MDGGRTAFPHVGAFATPRKGSAVFWYNLAHDGTEDRNSLHGGCPVLFGFKWGAGTKACLEKLKGAK